MQVPSKWKYSIPFYPEVLHFCSLLRIWGNKGEKMGLWVGPIRICGNQGENGGLGNSEIGFGRAEPRVPVPLSGGFQSLAGLWG